MAPPLGFLPPKRFRLAAAMVAAAFLGATALVQTGAAQSAPGVAPGITDCDRLAQLLRAALGRAALVDGVAPTAIDVPQVRAACEAAIAAHPQEPRFEAWLGRVFSEGGVHAEAAAAYRRAAEQGNPVAQSNLGALLQNGEDVARDDAQAVQWYRLAAHQGKANAQSNLGNMLRDGRGVARDDVQAVQSYRPAPTPEQIAAAERQLIRLYGTSGYLNNFRVHCMDGLMAREKDTNPEAAINLGGGGIGANVGPVCRGLMEFSANVHRNPARVEQVPHQDLLAPYRAIAADKGFSPSNGNARQVVNLAVNASSDPANANLTRITTPTTRNTTVVVNSGVVLDANFTHAILEWIENPANRPARQYPQLSSADISRAAEACNRNTATFSQCRAIGREIAAIYTANPPPVDPTSTFSPGRRPTTQ